MNHNTIKTIVTFVGRVRQDFQTQTIEIAYPNILFAQRPVPRGNVVLPPVPLNSNEIGNDKNSLYFLIQ